jgi:uncharacterized protein YbbC (DUF1343 family)
MVKMAYDMYPDKFLWKEPPYEYVFDKTPSMLFPVPDKIRKSFETGLGLNTIIENWQEPLKEFLETRKQFLLY